MIDLPGVSILDLQAAMAQKRITARELVFCCLERIARFDKGPDGLNSVLEINPDALFIADMLDEERRRGCVRGPLHGIPIMLKDTLNTADKMHTSAGSLALEDNLAPYDAHVVTRLRQAGALLLAKTNMTEFANFMGENMPAGYSSRGGQVLSPYNRACTPSGSSTGSAVAVAARMCAGALGTENFGSINFPAQQNGIVGIKPTMGLVSRHGNIPTTHTFDIVGPMASSVADAAVLLECIAGRDENDLSTCAQPPDHSPDYTRFLGSPDLEGVRVGINQKKLEAVSGKKGLAFENLLKTMQAAGAVLMEVEDVGAIISESDIDPIFFSECKTSMNAYLATLRPGLTCRSVQQIIDFNQRHASQALKYGQPILLRIQNQTSGGQTEPDYLAALARREQAIHALDAVFTTNQVDILLCAQCEFVAPVTGFPSMSLPVGIGEDHIPFGSYWIARRYDEKTMLRVTSVVERRLGFHCRPEFV